ncbi:MAG TPA: hypothetical protein VEC57_14605 [Candidatus Limnocylindrales bacterium]|nr:hypothetical protein [Candidatus Limnocylindrales bacterium]
MRMTVSVTGLKEAQEKMRGKFSARAVASVAAATLNRTVADLAKGWGEQLKTRLDRPTSATRNAPRFKRAQVNDLTAEVYIRDQGGGTPPAVWLAPEEFGGARRLKKFEQALQNQGALPPGHYVVPGPAAKLDAFGNVARSQIVQVIAQLGAKLSPGYQRVISPSAAKRAARATSLGRAYFAMPPSVKGLPGGIYERRQKKPVAVFYFVRSVSYRPRTELLGYAKRHAAASFARGFEKSWAEHWGSR